MCYKQSHSYYYWKEIAFSPSKVFQQANVPISGSIKQECTLAVVLSSMKGYFVNIYI